MLQEIRADKQELVSHSVFGNLQIISINAEGFESEEKMLRGRDIKKLRREMGWEFVGYWIETPGFIFLFDGLFLGSNRWFRCRY